MELILHIGIGKSGTSSIQHLLRENRDVLKERGILYVGYMFDRLENKVCEWQTVKGTQIFNKSDKSIREEQLKLVLNEAIKEAKKSHCHQILWSNEALADMTFLPELVRKLFKGKMTTIAFVRRHDSWAVSAYKQWGIKHKIFQGEVLSFDSWVARYPHTYYEKLSLWKDSSDNLIVKNFEKYSNITKVFFELINIDIDISEANEKRNKSGDMFDLLSAAVFNSLDPHPSLYTETQEFVKGRAFTIDWFNNKLPDQESIERVFQSTASDREQLNTLMSEEDQFDLDGDCLTLDALKLSQETFEEFTNACIFTLIYQQKTLTSKVEQLEERLAKLEMQSESVKSNRPWIVGRNKYFGRAE